jgi:hypothetical protein
VVFAAEHVLNGAFGLEVEATDLLDDLAGKHGVRGMKKKGSQETQRHRESSRRREAEAQALFLFAVVVFCFLCVSVSPVIRLFSA